MPRQTVPNQEPGSINVYTCKDCGRRIVVKHVDAGVTPFMVSCSNPSGEIQDTAGDCKGMMISSCYPKELPDDLPDPSYEVYRPYRDKGADGLALVLVTKYKHGAHRAIREHWRNGGALLRPIRKAAPDAKA